MEGAANSAARQPGNFPSAGKILVCLRFGIGDLIMEMPALEVLRRRLPSARIEALGARPAIDLLKRDPRVTRVYSLQDFGIGHLGDGGDPKTSARMKAWLRKKAYDVILDPSHAPIAVKHAVRENGGTILDARHDVPDPVLTTGGSALDAVKFVVGRNWGLPVPSHLIPHISVGLQDHVWAVSRLRHLFRARKPLIALSAAASSPLKKWDPGKLREIGSRLLESGYDLLLLCGPEGMEGDIDLMILAAMEGVTVIHNEHLLRVAALLARCKILICNDTGLMHIAAAVNTPVLALFGPTDPSIYLPRRAGSGALQGDQPGCEYRETSVLGHSRCIILGSCLKSERGCIHGIETGEVLEYLNRNLCRPQNEREVQTRT